MCKEWNDRRKRLERELRAAAIKLMKHMGVKNINLPIDSDGVEISIVRHDFTRNKD